MKKFITILFVFCLFSCVNKGKQGLFINEFSANSGMGYADIVSKEINDWIELYNGYDYDINLDDYGLAYVKSDSDYWQFPYGSTIKANSYLILVANKKDSALYTNFKLSKKKGSIYLINPSDSIIDKVSYGKIALNNSYGRITDGKNKWVHFDTPTPNSSNNTSKGAKDDKVSDSPIFNIAGGFYKKPQKIKLSCSKSAEIYYTINGDTPTRHSKKYSGSISIKETTVVKAIAVEKNKISSLPITNTYFIQTSKDLPVISLSSDHSSLWDDQVGIYSKSVRGISRYGNMEIFIDNEQVINQAVDIKISGHWARKSELKALQIVANEEYGNEYIQYPIFPEKPTDKYSALLLRCGGHPDKYYTTFRDGLGQYLTDTYLHLDHSGYRPCVVYINGKYWGIYNIREKMNANFIKDHYGYGDNDFSMLQESWLEIRNGNRDHFHQLMNFLSSCDKSVKDNYEKVDSMMDVDNFINYTIGECYPANVDWPNWNLKFFRHHSDTARWRWILNDLDFGFGDGAKKDFNMMEYITSEVMTRETNPPKATKIFRKLFEFKWFKQEFIQRLAAALNEVYSPERVETFINKFENEKISEMPNHLKRWKNVSFESPWNYTFTLPKNLKQWQEKIDIVRDFASDRPEYMRKNVISKFQLSGLVDISTIAYNGTISINTIPIRKDSTIGIYFKDVPLKATCKPSPGFVFSYWMVNNQKIKTPNLNYNPINDTKIKAVFKKVIEGNDS